VDIIWKELLNDIHKKSGKIICFKKERQNQHSRATGHTILGRGGNPTNLISPKKKYFPCTYTKSTVCSCFLSTNPSPITIKYIPLLLHLWRVSIMLAETALISWCPFLLHVPIYRFLLLQLPCCSTFNHTSMTFTEPNAGHIHLIKITVQLPNKFHWFIYNIFH